jgi:hypothetical protein
MSNTCWVVSKCYYNDNFTIIKGVYLEKPPERLMASWIEQNEENDYYCIQVEEYPLI